MTQPDWEAIQKQVDERYKCAHEEREVRLRTLQNGNRIFVSQCLNCGTMQAVAKTSLTFIQRQKAEGRPADETLRERYYQALSEYRQSLVEAARSAQQEAWNDWYYGERLASEKWRALCRKVIRRDKGVCQCCLEAPATQVHHLTYARVGNEALFDLVAVCESCHRNILHPDKQREDAS